MSNEEDMTQDEFETLAARIKHLLNIYPGISPTMLQSALGPQTPPSEWREVLEGMIKTGVVIQSVQTATTPSGRYNDYKKLSLTQA